MPQWNMEEIKPLFDAVAEAYVWASRYNDTILLHYLRLILNLAYARFPYVNENVGVIENENNDDTRT